MTEKKKPFIELVYQSYEPKKLAFPVAFQQKFDGVPVRIINVGGNILAYSRQGEQVTCIKHLLEHAKYLLLELGSSITGELYVAGLPFKDISGMARQTKMQSPKLCMYVFDFDLLNKPDYEWITRHNVFSKALGTYLDVAGLAPSDCPIKLAPSATCQDDLSVQSCLDMLLTAFPSAEGAVVHSLSKPYRPGTRPALSQKLLKEPTIDVLVKGFEEAKDTYTKRGNGMVGRVIVDISRMQPSADGSTKLVTVEQGVGPGALTHAERKLLFTMQQQGRFKPRIAEVKYKKDDSYTMLRQPTFVRWRSDKEIADEYKP